MKKRGGERPCQASGLQSVTDRAISAQWASLTDPAETLEKVLKNSKSEMRYIHLRSGFVQVLKLFCPV